MDSKQKAKCQRFMNRVLTMIPPHQQNHDASHASIVYFGVLSLEILGSNVNALEVETYLKQLQTQNGFKMSISFKNDTHLTAIYFCLALRRMVNSDLVVDKNKIIEFLKTCQKENGAFAETRESTNFSMKHAYSAFAVSKLLDMPTDEWAPKTVKYILECQNYDGGFGDKRGDESHAALTFCAVASLKMAGALDKADPLVSTYLQKRQTELGGHNGRPNKLTDVCYSFWCLCALKILQSPVSKESEKEVRNYLMTQGYDDMLGGFAKIAGEHADPYHTALALGALACLDNQLDPVLCVPYSN